MKLLATILQVIVILCIQLSAEEPSLPSVEEFLNSTPERAYQILNSPTGAYQIGIYAQAAVASGRTELVMVCFQNPNSWDSALSAIAALPESPQRDKWTISMLRCPSNLWPCEDIADGSRLIPKDVMDEPFASLVRRLLPGHPVGGLEVFTKEKRLKLAAKLEAALGQDRPTQNPQALPPGDAVVEHPSGISSKPPSAPQAPPQQPIASTSLLVWFGILGTVIALLFLWLKRRK